MFNLESLLDKKKYFSNLLNLEEEKFLLVNGHNFLLTEIKNSKTILSLEILEKHLKNSSKKQIEKYKMPKIIRKTSDLILKK